MNSTLFPKSELKPSRGALRWRFTLMLNKKDTQSASQKKYLNKWHLVHSDFTKGESLFIN